MKNVLILEDNEHTLERLKRIVTSMEVQVFTATQTPEAYKIACEHNIDIFMVDIVLDKQVHSDTSGIRFAMAMREIPRYKRATLIFITSLEDPKLDAYAKLHCFRYIEKPFREVELRRVMKEALELPQLQIQRKEYVSLRVQKMHVIKRIDDIVYIEKLNRIMTVYSTDGEVQVMYKTMKEIIDELDNPKFKQCSRSTIINMEYVKSIDPINRYIELIDDWGTVEIGPKYKFKFMEAYGDA